MPKIAVWKTGHEIADRVAVSLQRGMPYDDLTGLPCQIYDTSYSDTADQNDVNIGYGILRGMDRVFRKSESLMKGISNAEERQANSDGIESIGSINIAYGILRGTDRLFKNFQSWFNVDRGYFSPSHYDGFYRISYRGTQAKYDAAYPVQKHNWKLESVKINYTKNILVCPPTVEVCKFFGVDEWSWMIRNVSKDAHQNPYTKEWFFVGSKWGSYGGNFIVRKKGDQSPILWDDISAVITFNSSVGWQAIQRGIPCLSDTTHSVVGSYYNTNSLDEVIEKFNSMPREPLLDFCRAHQFTLAEIELGQAWSLLKYYTSGSVTIAEKPLPPMFAPTLSSDGLKNHFQSTI